METLSGVVGLVMFLALLVEFLGERLLTPFLKGVRMVWATALVGGALCVLLKVDGLSLVGVNANLYVSYVVTGLIVGSGSNAVHQFLKPLRKP